MVSSLNPHTREIQTAGCVDGSMVVDLDTVLDAASAPGADTPASAVAWGVLCRHPTATDCDALAGDIRRRTEIQGGFFLVVNDEEGRDVCSGAYDDDGHPVTMPTPTSLGP